MLALLTLTGSALAQQDSFGLVDVFYIDSVKAGPGQDVSVGFRIRNDEPLSSVSLPIKYDHNLLTVKEISFVGSRASYMSQKQVTPPLGNIQGHFWVSLMPPYSTPLPAGDGLVFTAVFSISSSAPAGAVFAIDSLLYAPAGDLTFAEASSGETIVPRFVPGEIAVVNAVNHSPSIASLPPQYVFEGDDLVVRFEAYDPDGGLLRFVCSDKPLGASFADNGDGTATLLWQPEYIGPSSADGSPFSVSVRVSDGDLSGEKDVSINVLNKNRRPSISVAEAAAFNAGTTLILPVSASDPDFEALDWSVSGLPQAAQFDNGNPGRLSWPTQLGDSGTTRITFMASDPQGASDTAVVGVTILPVSLFALSLDTVSGYPGDRVSYGVNLDNKQAVGSFNLLFSYDPTIVTPSGATLVGTRAAGFEYFTYNYADDDVVGNIRIVGIADQAGGQTTLPLDAGVGSICKLTFRIVSDLTYSGYRAWTRFAFLDENDNTMTGGSGAGIEQSAIDYYDGWVTVLSIGQIKVGDINLNGIAFDISDAIYFSNFLMNPAGYPMSVLQYANSDINGDNMAATVADLVALIKVIVNGGQTGKQAVSPLEASVTYSASADGTVFSYDAGFDVGGVLVTLETDEAVTVDDVKSLCDDMTVQCHQEGTEVRILLCSLEGNDMPAGKRAFLSISGLTDWKMTAVSMASAEGEAVTVARSESQPGLPDDFSLAQNYPNPFNPETRVDFSLAAASHSRLTVYNVLGREVKVLVNDKLSAGSHSVVWNGTDESGDPAASGVYYYRLETAAGSLTRKMVLLK